MDRNKRRALKKVAILEKFRLKRGLDKETYYGELVARALKDMREEENIVYEYVIDFVIPYNSDGGTYRSKIDKFTASNSAEAVRYISDKYGFPAFDPFEFGEPGSKEFMDADNYGIYKVRKNIDGDKRFNEKEMLESWYFIFKTIIREFHLERAKMKETNNISEVLKVLIKKYKMPTNNRLTEIYT